ncbi:MAG TPA: type II toxin-antitoxin system RelE/ParE family toxin [Cyclobacteriaceae bacterium]|nr:type II toxin-antitoxin system RelE/ParE family toxin [Cyclobacteriaceae bacterium]
MTKEYVAYKGDAFQIEWYYSEKGESQARDYYLELDDQDRKQVLKLFKMMGDIGKIYDKTKFNNEGDKVYAFKPQPHRFLSFFLQGKKIIVTNAFWKKQDKLPENEKEKALKYMESYLERVKKGTYYEKED